MRRFPMALGVLAAVLFVAGVSAQKTKDFTGTWTADTDKNGAAAAGGRGGASDFVVTMDAKTMNIATTRQGTTSNVTYHLDGTESKNVSARGGATAEVVSIAKWDGDKLVITTKGANGDSKTSYWLEAGDLIRETLAGAPGRDGAAPTPVRTYFKKK
jgi:hypothetical protein